MARLWLIVCSRMSLTTWPPSTRSTTVANCTFIFRPVSIPSKATCRVPNDTDLATGAPFVGIEDTTVAWWMPVPRCHLPGLATSRTCGPCLPPWSSPGQGQVGNPAVLQAGPARAVLAVVVEQVAVGEAGAALPVRAGRAGKVLPIRQVAWCTGFLLPATNRCQVRAITPAPTKKAAEIRGFGSCRGIRATGNGQAGLQISDRSVQRPAAGECPQGGAPGLFGLWAISARRPRRAWAR